MVRLPDLPVFTMTLLNVKRCVSRPNSVPVGFQLISRFNVSYTPRLRSGVFCPFRDA